MVKTFLVVLIATTSLLGCDEIDLARNAAPPDLAAADLQTLPDAMVDGPALPETCPPDMPRPDLTLPPNEEAGTPDLPKPDLALPDLALPDKALPDLALPDKALPDKAVPDVAVPDAAMPDVTVPDKALPDKTVPDKTIPDLPLPDLPLPTCTDGVKNGDESDTDCGGKTCLPCALGKACKAHHDCKPHQCLNGVCAYATSCMQILNMHKGMPSGTYTLRPDPTLPALKMYCDMVTDGGGWTMVQRVVWSWSKSKALYTNYSTFHGNTVGSLSSAWRAAGKLWLPLNVKKDFLIVYRLRLKSGGACGPLYYKGTGGTLTADPIKKSFSLTGLKMAAAGLMTNGVTALSTTDSGPSQGCVKTGLGVPWFWASCCVLCATYKGMYWTDEPHPQVRSTVITKSKDILGSTPAQVCSGSVMLSKKDGISTFHGIDRLEFYQR